MTDGLETEQDRTGPSPSIPTHWTDLFPIAVLGFMSGMFTTLYLGYQSEPAIGETMAAVFAVLTALATLGLCVISARGERA